MQKNGDIALVTLKNIDMVFQSKTKYDFKKVNIVGDKDIKLTNKILNNKYL